jgi:hypothetical protein
MATGRAIRDRPEEWDATKQSNAIFGIAIGMQHLHSNNIMHHDLKRAISCFPELGADHRRFRAALPREGRGDARIQGAGDHQ